MVMLCRPLTLLVCVGLLHVTANAEDMNKIRELTDVVAVEGDTARLPCNTSVTQNGDSIKMVFWFKGYGGPSIFAHDSVGQSWPREGNQILSDEFDERTRLVIEDRVSWLVISRVQRDDQMMYRCRVDFGHSPTRNLRVNLTVVVAPGHPVVYESDGEAVQARTSPLKIGHSATFKCMATQGRPPANLTWWRQNSLVDRAWNREPSENDIEAKVTNQLTVGPVTRRDLGTRYTCTASNHVLSPPRSASIVIDMILAPLSVQIESLLSSSALSAGQLVSASCSSVGCRPACHITWWLDDNQLSGAREVVTNSGNRTRSTLELALQMNHAGRTLRCTATNPRLRNEPHHDSQLLHVLYRPALNLSMWSTSRDQGVFEGDQVHMRCLVRADPPPSSITWLKQSRPITEFAELREAEVKDDLLVLRHVTWVMSGHYSCRAGNNQGSSTSSQQLLQVTGFPRCDTRGDTVVHVARGEQVNITCRVRSVPAPVSYTWTLNSSAGESMVLTSEDAMVRYTPRSQADYGSLLCRARNAVGIQPLPCVFNIIMTERPSAPTNCRLSNSTLTSVEVMCVAGSSGGLEQTFAAEIVINSSSHSSNSSRDNSTSRPPSPTSTPPTVYHSLTPRFVLDDLIPDRNYTINIYAFNSKGRSDVVSLQATTLQEDTVEPLRFLASVLRVTPLLGVLIGMAGTLVVLAIVICIALRLRTRHHAHKPRPVPAIISHVPSSDGHVASVDVSHVRSDTVGNSTCRNRFDLLTDPVERDMAERLVGRQAHCAHDHQTLGKPLTDHSMPNIINHYPSRAMFSADNVESSSLLLPPAALTCAGRSGTLPHCAAPSAGLRHHSGTAPCVRAGCADSDGSDTHGDATFSETTSTVGETAPLMNCSGTSAASRRESSV